MMLLFFCVCVCFFTAGLVNLEFKLEIFWMSFTETEADWMSESGTIAQQGHSDDQTW